MSFFDKINDVVIVDVLSFVILTDPSTLSLVHMLMLFIQDVCGLPLLHLMALFLV